MRLLWILLPVALMAQTSSKPATAPAKPAARTAAPVKRRAAAKPKPATPAAPVALTTDEEKTIYAIGLIEHQRLQSLHLSPAEMALVERAMKDAQAGKPAIELKDWSPKVSAFAQARMALESEKQKAEGKAYLDKAAADPGAVRAASGLVYKELRPGTGASPKATDTVKVHYRGTLIDGVEFDSSYSRNVPASFPLSRVIPCWTEGVQMMKVGGKAQLVCPSEIAYGPAGRPPKIPGGATLVFEVELLDISAATE